MTVAGREIVVGVTGGIAAFKTAALVSKLVQDGAAVSVVMTDAACRFIGPPTFEALTGRPPADVSVDRVIGAWAQLYRLLLPEEGAR